ncbi:hypothetical protein C2G38_2087824 [Gigaspora rosea]|uniref:Uncharacterized protein n=1 Tax=Gigaspora rosea TaxID=44941 RepID=A0A397V5C2_9GLOM|nr:hypothetical protein C2G38_2087824 [Gigaspora rosea]
MDLIIGINFSKIFLIHGSRHFALIIGISKRKNYQRVLNLELHIKQFPLMHQNTLNIFSINLNLWVALHNTLLYFTYMIALIVIQIS